MALTTSRTQPGSRKETKSPSLSFLPLPFVIKVIKNVVRLQEKPECPTPGVCVLCGESERGKGMILGNVGRVWANFRGQIEGIFASWPGVILCRGSETLWRYGEGQERGRRGGDRVGTEGHKGKRMVHLSVFHAELASENPQQLGSHENYIKKQKKHLIRSSRTLGV